MVTALEEYFTEEQRSVVRFLWAKELNAKDLHKEMFPAYGGKCSSRRERKKKKKKKKTPWFQSASELYRPSDRRLSANFSANFCGWRVSRGQLNESPRPLISVF
jgi:hypothetical protein